MYRFLMITCALLILKATSQAQEKEYKLVVRHTAADFNYRAIRQIDRAQTGEERRAVFHPIKGRYTVYVFMATYTGLSFTGSHKDFHDILILKTGKDGRVKDAFHYTLEWAEPPFSYDLYRATAQVGVLGPGLSIEQLQLRRFGYAKKESGALRETGVLQLPIGNGGLIK